MAERSEGTPFYLFFIAIQVFLVLVYGFCTEYDEFASARYMFEGVKNTIDGYYPYFQDVHVMMFVGFGFLMTFLKRYGYSALGWNFLLAAFAIQLHILIQDFWFQAFDNHWHKVQLNIQAFINADYCAAAVLITFGGLLGKVNLQQLIVIEFLEVWLYSLNQTIVVYSYDIADIGGSIIIHTFGAYFGLAAALVINCVGKNRHKDRYLNSASYSSDLFSMIGTLFLWMYWPSFNGAMGVGNQRHRAIINTIFSLIGSCFWTFILSRMFNGQFKMVDVQNATLAGGVAIGATADMNIGAHGAFIIGGFAGIISVIGFNFLQPKLKALIHLDDTCGIHNLHALPGVIGGLASVCATAIIPFADYEENVKFVYRGFMHNEPTDH